MVTCSWEPLMPNLQKPPLESCARRNVPGSGEAQRRTGVNGDRAGYVFVSIRVVPPSDRSLFGSDDPAFFVSVDRMSSLFQKRKEREMADKKW